MSVPEQYILYEKPVAKGFIDGYIADTRVLIEQKGMAFDLDVKEPRQGRMVTPYDAFGTDTIAETLALPKTLITGTEKGKRTRGMMLLLHSLCGI